MGAKLGSCQPWRRSRNETTMRNPPGHHKSVHADSTSSSSPLWQDLVRGTRDLHLIEATPSTSRRARADLSVSSMQVHSLYNTPVTRHSHVVQSRFVCRARVCTNGCALDRSGSAFVRQLAAPGPPVCRPSPASHAFAPRFVLRSSHVQHLNMKYETASHQWGIPAAISPFKV